MRHVGPYRLIEPIGRGAMGEVVRAVDVATGQAVALKLLRPGDPRAGFGREVAALGRLRHPGIVRVHQGGVHDGLAWYAMDLVEGHTLRQQLGDLSQGRGGGQAPTLQTALDVACRLCAPLAYLHGEGIVHRDLKPENVMFRSDGRLVLVDFGLAVEFPGAVSREKLHVEIEAAGTLCYMAPEQLLGELCDARADLYALGCIMYELLSGRPPFMGGSLAELCERIVKEPPRPLAAVLPHAPSELSELVSALLAKGPRDRIGHADLVAARLEELGARRDEGGESPAPRAYLYRPGFTGRGDLASAFGEEVVSSLDRGKGAAILVAGESGAGKTRLLMEVARALKRKGVAVLASSCDPAQSPAALSALSAVANLDAPPAHLLPPEEARHRLLRSMLDAAVAAAEGSGLLLILDDLQDADELTLSFLHLLCGSLGRAPVSVMGAYRIEEASDSLRSLSERDGVRRVVLDRLDDDVVGDLAAEMLALPAPPPDLLRLLCHHAGGNPFFIAEYLRAAVASGMLLRDTRGRWKLRALARDEALPLPGTLHELIRARLDGLDASARLLAETASVLGRDADVDLLQSVAGLDEPAWLDSLRQLVARQVLEKKGSGRIAFLHGTIRDVTYDAMDEERRRGIHRSAAMALEERPATVVGRDGALARHWERAGEAERARPLYLRAARDAMGQYLYREAERLFESYLALSPDLTAERLEARIDLAEAIRRHGALALALRQIDVAREEARRLPADRELAKATRMAATMTRMMGRIDEALPLYEEAHSLSQSCGDWEGVASTVYGLANVATQQGRAQDARSLYERALDLSRELGDRSLECSVLSGMAILGEQTGLLKEALLSYERALAISRDLGDRDTQGVILAGLANLIEDLDESRATYEAAVAIHRETGNRRREGIALANLAFVLKRQGRGDAAKELYEHALAIHREVGNRRSEGVLLGNIAEVAFEEGRIADARLLLSQAYEIHVEVADRWMQGVNRYLLADLERRGRNLEEAEWLLDEAEEILEEVGDRRERASARAVRGLVRLARGLPADDILIEVREVARELGVTLRSDLGRALAKLERKVARSRGAR